jgi:carboxylesterase type B
MLSPLSKNLFKRAILESGSALMPISLITDQQIEETASDVLTTCGCNRSEIRESAACLRSVPLQLLLEAQSKIIRRKDDTTFSPSFFDDFLPKHPIDAMREGDFGVDKEVLMGFNKNEGSLFMYFANPTKYPALGSKAAPEGEISMQSVYEFASRFMRSQNPIATKNLLNSLYVDVRDESIFNVTQSHVGEFFVSCPVIFAADDFSHHNLSVYFYHFTHRPKNTPWSPWIGAAHFDEVQFLFGLPLAFPQSYTREEVKLSKRMMHAWASFARTGRPEIPSYSQWPKYTTDQQTFVEFSARSTRIRKKLPQQKCNLWKLTFEVAHSQASAAGEPIMETKSKNQTSTDELHVEAEDDSADDEDPDSDS